MRSTKNFILLLVSCLIMVSCKKDDEIQLSSILTIDYHVINSNETECTGTILNSGTKEVFEVGFCWSVDSLPNISTGRYETVRDARDTFSLRITKLLPQTRYYVRAFGTNELGTFYGNTLSFTTDANDTSLLIDKRDNQAYKVVYINDVAWMAENLNYNIEGSGYYNNDSLAYSGTHGRLYTWEAAMNACPAGWELPSDDDWMRLEEATGMQTDEIIDSHIRGGEADQLLVGGIQDLDITLSGYKMVDNWLEFEHKGGYWTSTYQENGIYYRGFQLNIPGIYRDIKGNDMQYSVRCINK